jgi:lysophospholipase L1-like esterase
LTLTSCADEQSKNEEVIDNPDIEIVEDPSTNEAIRFLALGDSYTIGQGVFIYQRWPNQIRQKLGLLNYTIDSLKIIAQTGWTTNNLLNSIENTEISGFNLVSLLIGVNNQFQNKPFSTFETEFNILLNKSIEFAGDINRVFVVSIPDYGVTPFGSSNSESIAEDIDMYNTYISLQCEEKGIPFINITEISRELGDSDGALASDNLHPSASQYTEWADKILPIVIELLEE